MGVSLFAPRRSLATGDSSSENPLEEVRTASGRSRKTSRSAVKETADEPPKRERSPKEARERTSQRLLGPDQPQRRSEDAVAERSAERSADEPKTKHGYAREAAALLLLASALYTALALASFRGDPMRAEVVGEDWVGPVGALFAGLIVEAAGVCGWLVPIDLAIFAVPLLQGKKSRVSFVRVAGDLVVLVVLAALLHVAFPTSHSFGGMPIGGSVGELFGEVMRALFSAVGSYIVGITIVSLILIGRAAFSLIDWAQRVEQRARVLRDRGEGGIRSIMGAWDQARVLDEKRREDERKAFEPVITEACDDAIIAALADDSPAFPKVKPLAVAPLAPRLALATAAAPAALGPSASVPAKATPVVAAPPPNGSVAAAVAGSENRVETLANEAFPDRDGASVQALAADAETPTPLPVAAKRGRKKQVVPSAETSVAAASANASADLISPKAETSPAVLGAGSAVAGTSSAIISLSSWAEGKDFAGVTARAEGENIAAAATVNDTPKADLSSENDSARTNETDDVNESDSQSESDAVASCTSDTKGHVADAAPAAPLAASAKAAFPAAPSPPAPRVQTPAPVRAAPPPAPIQAPPPEPALVIIDTSAALKTQKPALEIPKIVPAWDEGFRLPNTNLLEEAKGGRVHVDGDQLKNTAVQLEKVLADYGISGKVEEIHPGPTVTTFEVVPAAGTKVSKVASLADDLALGLSRKVRIVAPIPGKNRIGFEVPNDKRMPVVMRELVEDKRFMEMSAPLPCVLGRDIIGAPYFADLASMPHVIVAGATGAGKSVGLNVMLISLLYRRTPAELRLLMIDPKVVELAPFDGIPHMLLPVVTDMKQASNALKWAVDEMERRYQLFANAGTRNITTYNGWAERVQRGEIKAPKKTQAAKVSAFAADGTDVMVAAAGDGSDDELPETLPFIVIVVDEFADLMMQQGKEVEVSVARLAQKARAAGMHVILATQRPSVDVITGMIKANFPTRIAFRVAQKVDSRTILDEQGAEHLLGRGDMLVKMNGSNETRRVQCPFCSEEEVQRVTDFLRLQGTPVYDENILKPRDEDGEESAPEEDEMDAMYDAAVRVVADTRRCSTSWLQRKLGVGYNRAAKMVEAMEKRGVVGPANGAKDREVLIGSI